MTDSIRLRHEDELAPLCFPRFASRFGINLSVRRLVGDAACVALTIGLDTVTNDLQRLVEASDRMCIPMEGV